MSDLNFLLQEYKNLYENMKRDNDKFIQIMLNMKDTMDTMRDVIKDLQDDNQNLRSHLSIIHNRSLRNHENQQDQYEATFYIEADNHNNNQNRNLQTYSIPPHIRQNYLNNLSEDQTCSICLTRVENNNTMQLTDCGHLFHIDCLRRHRQNNDNCPVCRREL